MADWMESKENFQPLKEGRKAGDLDNSAAPCSAEYNAKRR